MNAKQHPRNLVLELTPAQAFLVYYAMNGINVNDLTHDDAIQQSLVDQLRLAEDELRDQNSKEPLRGGTCRYCGCTEAHACVVAPLPNVSHDNIVGCSWADDEQTICTNPLCLAQ